MKKAIQQRDVLSYPLHVCIDARKHSHGGIGVYIQNAITALLRHGVKLTLLLNEEDSVLSNISPSVKTQVVSAKPSTFRELFFLASEVDWEGVDVFHTPNYILPFGVPVPSVITVHDLIHIKLPERWTYPLMALPLLGLLSLELVASSQ